MSRINKENAVRNVYRVWMIGMLLILMVLAFAGCGQAPAQGAAPSGGKLRIVATTTMLADLARELGGDKVEVSALMEAGIDPHLYKASAGDVETMQKADLVVYNGLHLEGKMEEVFENLEKMGKSVVMIASNLSEDQLLKDEESGGHDPHIWFDVKIWKAAAVNLRDGLIARDSANADFYKERYNQYAVKLDELDAY
ncbi:MAG: zinc ABC transporter substrate-binding protein, partial [Bacillota bacterium]|nr:zinc ABC transporter substrate-binding protein [Bacillota bacterium]